MLACMQEDLLEDDVEFSEGAVKMFVGVTPHL